MMNTMLVEEGINFKEFEQKTFKMICEWGQQFTKEFLEKYDKYLMDTRDKKAYRHKGLKKTSIKTLYGEVEYERRLYRVKREDGLEESVFLLDEQLKIASVGLISENMAEQLVSGITEMSYRECAQKVTEMTGQPISAMGVWNVIQTLGEQVCEDERKLVKEHKAGLVKGEIETPVLFEEADGVYIRLQKEKKKSVEIKVGIAYDGWKEVSPNRYALDEKVVVAGISNTIDFQNYREAAIAQRYNTDEIEMRLMNADGAQWIKNACEAETVFQLDPFHRNKAIRDYVSDKKAVAWINDLIEEKNINELFRFLDIYKESLSDDEEIEKIEKLHTYFKNNRDGLLPYQARGYKLPEHPKGLVYRNMGTMENHIWSTIARRMKHNHTCWSRKGANHLSKILAKKCSGRLNEVTEKLKAPEFDGIKAREIEKEILSASAIPQKVGKRYRYPIQGHLTGLDRPGKMTHRTMLAMVGC